MCWKRSLAISLASAALALAGCGGDEEPAVNTGDPTPAAEFAAHAPGDLRAGQRRDAQGRRARRTTCYTTAVLVRGVAEPDARVVVSTGCKDEGCQKAVRTAADGAFEAEVSLEADAEQPRGTIVVGYEDSGESVDSDRVIVTVEPPGVADLPTEDTTNPGKQEAEVVKTKAGAAADQRAAGARRRRPARPRPPPVDLQRRRRTSARNLVVIGDSLAVGMQPYLQQYLPGWNITVDARVGRPLAEGMRQFDAKPRPVERDRLRLQPVHQRRPDATGRARERRQAQHHQGLRGLVDDRPPAGRRHLLRRRQLPAQRASPRTACRSSSGPTRWPRNPGWIAGDGVHGTPTGYRNRAALYAAAIKTCSG